MANQTNGKITDVTIQTNKKEYLAALEEVAERVLNMWGMSAVNSAIEHARYDTGLMRNSITYAVAGESANKTDYKSDDGETSGSYSGTAPEDKGGEKRTVHIGSNVEYAMAQETGDFRDGSHAFLRPAIDENREYFREILEGELKKAMDNDNT